MSFINAFNDVLDPNVRFCGCIFLTLAFMAIVGFFYVKIFSGWEKKKRN